MSKELLFANIAALKPIEKLLEEAGKAVADPTRVQATDSEMNAALITAGGIGTGAGIGFAGLYFGGITGLSAAGITSGLATAGALVGGSMAAGIAVIAAPAVALGIAGYAITARRNRKKLIERKTALMQAVLRKHDAVISELGKNSQANSARADYLMRLNTLLQAAMDDLHRDLGTAQ